MPSNCNESIRSCALYKPPHLRKELVETVYSLNNNTSSLNNNVSNCVNNNSKVNNNDISNSENKESVTKLYIPPAKRNLNNAGQYKYFDCKFKGTRSEYSKKLKESTTVYVGHLNLLSTEEDIHKLFSEAGKIKTIIMGLDRNTLGPGGFCFIEYETRIETENCMKIMNGTLLDGKRLLIDWDAGFIEGRQYRRVKRNQQKTSVFSTTQK
ncbi:nuclear cap-binding protein subunit 2-like [Melanaphis sacchari]|uniref:Nuclear cap-binding protein subunit 2 n=1 Tax=Melanaphis sacchari TaxID=742174 RepID=A0A2H8TPF0_9HEMI|nr:nuclear cap-binding protein subunit 2-like [Melanaphis sacchari]